MALSATRLRDSIKAALIASGASDNGATTTLATDLASAIVSEIVTYATVQPTLLIAPGGMSPAPVTGTGTIT